MPSPRNIEVKPDIETFAKIKVIGVGGAGGAALTRMTKDRIRGVELVAVNTDAQAMHRLDVAERIHIGRATTRGLGAGMDPEVGRKSAEENLEDIKQVVDGCDMVFITCGLGGGTGTGAAPVVAEAAKEAGCLTVAIVTKPFAFEGAQRRAIAEAGYDALSAVVDTIITIPNDRLLQIIDKKTSLLDAFAIVDEVLRQGVQGISELITVPGLINVDFADVKAIMQNAGSALMGIGTGTGENRAAVAAKSAVESPLLEVSIDGAKGILFTISGGENMTMYEVNEAAKIITDAADPNAKIIFGSVLDTTLRDEVKITVVATGFGGHVSRSREVARVAAPVASGPTSAAGANFFGRQRGMRVTTPPTAPVPTRDERPVPAAPVTPDPLDEIDAELPGSDDDMDIPAFIRKKMN
jgi:cell division protein FtsZ